MSFVKQVKYHVNNIPGWRTKRKIVVFESDDWGSIRMRSNEILKHLEKKGLIPKNDYYNRYDALASESDLTNFFEVLSSIKDVNGNFPVFTANTIVANPDYDRIATSGYEKYYFEIFTETLKKYPKHGNAFSLWKEGIDNRVFHPQYHGRDHVNVDTWLNRLKNNESNAKIAFENRVLGLRHATNIRNRDYYYMRALDSSTHANLNKKLVSIDEGAHIFHNIFNYQSKSFIAPSYVWNDEIERILAHNGVKYIQGIRLQKKPVIGKKNLTNKLHFIGDKNKFDQIYLVRNVFFEPTLTRFDNVIENTLNRINIAFRWNKPAIIGSHRLNYIGFIDEKNRDKNLNLLKLLLNKILQKWPEVEFMTSDMLGDLIKLKVKKNDLINENSYTP